MNATMNTPAAVPEVQSPEAAGVKDYSDRLSDGQANSIYAAAYHMSQQGKHEQASTLFALLSMYCPREPKYTRSVAICFRKMRRYEDAIRYFAKTMELRPDNFEPAFQLVECMLLMGRRDDAVDLLEKFATMATDTGQTSILDQASAMLELLNAPAHSQEVAGSETTE